MEDEILSGSLVPSLRQVADDDDDRHDKFRATLSDLLAPRRSKELDRPDISHLEDAIAPDPLTGQPVLKVRAGERIVIERRATILEGPNKPWMDTRLWWVNAVDQERGLLKLFDEGLRQHGSDSYIVGLNAGQVYKIPPKDRRWDAPPPKRKVEPKPVQLTEHGEVVKKKRGRPKGSKNRASDVIKAEKQERKEAKAARLARRK